VPDNDPRAFECVECLEKKELKRRRLDPVDVPGETRHHRHLGLLDKIPDCRRLTQRTAGPEMYHPVREPVIHHSGELGELYAVAMEMNSTGRPMKSEIKHPVVPLAEQIEVVLQFFPRIARQMAKLRVHSLRDQL